LPSIVFGIAPVEAVHRVLARAEIGSTDLVAVVPNEAFAGHSLAYLGQWPRLDLQIVNVNRGRP
jgi:acetyl-CoA acetyltransferase